MEAMSLTTLGAEHLAKAKAASSGRSADTLHGGHEHELRQTILALASGFGLDEHESPGEATLQVLRGRARLRTTGDDAVDLGAGDLVVIPPQRHALDALEDSVVLLTVSTKLKA